MAEQRCLRNASCTCPDCSTNTLTAADLLDSVPVGEDGQEQLGGMDGAALDEGTCVSWPGGGGGGGDLVNLPDEVHERDAYW